MNLYNDAFMKRALELAHVSKDLGEVPVGAVLVIDDVIVSEGINRRELLHSVLEHAEMNAIKEASARLGRWRLVDATLYSTLEPCIMCASALMHSRIKGLFFGAKDPKFGGIESLYSIASDSRLNHRFFAEGGHREMESQAVLQSFFRNIRLTK